MTSGPRLTLVALSEDAGQTGWSALHRLVRHTLDLLVPDLDWEMGVEVVPRPEVPVRVQQVCAGNRWRSTRAGDLPQRGVLFRYVAERLDESTERPQLVLFHVDGDRAWSERRSNPSDNLRQFDDVVRTGVQRVLRERPSPLDDATVDRLMARLLVIPPYYSIEAWLYQATERAKALCRERQCAGVHAGTYDAWCADRGALDERRMPKERDGAAGPHCLTDDDKDTLARHFPAAEVWAAQKSYAAWVEGLAADAEFMAALRQARYTQG